MNILTRIRQHFCRHKIYLGDLTRLGDSLVEARCLKCGKVLRAAYGLAMDAELTSVKPMTTKPKP